MANILHRTSCYSVANNEMESVTAAHILAPEVKYLLPTKFILL